MNSAFCLKPPNSVSFIVCCAEPIVFPLSFFPFYFTPFDIRLVYFVVVILILSVQIKMHSSNRSRVLSNSGVGCRCRFVVVYYHISNKKDSKYWCYFCSLVLFCFSHISHFDCVHIIIDSMWNSTPMTATDSIECKP